MNKYHLTLAAIAASTATIVAVTIIADPSPAPADMFQGVHFSAPDTLADDEYLNAPSVSYESDSMHYKVSYPGTWRLQDSPEHLDGHILAEPSEHVVITITQTQQDILQNDEELEDIARSIEQSLLYDSSFTLDSFEQFLWRGKTVIYTEGKRTIGSHMYHTREYNILREQYASMLNVSITTKASAQALYEDTIQEILESLEV